MQSHELLREVFQKGSAKKIAADMGLSLSMIYKWAEPPEPSTGSGSSNPLDRIASLYKSTGDLSIIRWVCELADGFYIRNPNATHQQQDRLIPATNEIIQEFADLLSVIATAVADNQISPSEAKDIRGRWEELKSVTEEFVQCCEQGNFRAARVAKNPGNDNPNPRP